MWWQHWIFSSHYSCLWCHVILQKSLLSMWKTVVLPTFFVATNILKVQKHLFFSSFKNDVLLGITVPLYTVIGGLNYYVLTFQLIMWYNALIVYIHVFTLYLYFKKYLHTISSVINLCNYIYNYTVDPPLNLPIPPNLSLTSPVSNLNSSKSVLQYNMDTISTLYLCFYSS